MTTYPKLYPKRALLFVPPDRVPYTSTIPNAITAACGGLLIFGDTELRGSLVHLRNAMFLSTMGRSISDICVQKNVGKFMPIADGTTLHQGNISFCAPIGDTFAPEGEPSDKPYPSHALIYVRPGWIFGGSITACEGRIYLGDSPVWTEGIHNGYSIFDVATRPFHEVVSSSWQLPDNTFVREEDATLVVPVPADNLRARTKEGKQ